MQVQELVRRFDIPQLITPVKEIDVADLTGDEEAAIYETLDLIAEKIGAISTKLERWWRDTYPAFIAGAAVLKAVTGGEKTFSSARIDDMAGQLCGSFIIPEDFGKTDFTVNITKGTAAYLWGDGTNYFTPSTTVNKRCVIVVMKNGIVYLDEKPIGEQFWFIGKENTYYPWRSPIVDEQSLEEDRLIYASYTPAPMLLPPRSGSMLKVMPERTATGAKYYIFGMAFFERDYYTDVTAASLL